MNASPSFLQSLDFARHSASSRYMPRPVPLVSRLIGGGAAIVFMALIIQSFFQQDLTAWSIGLVYIFYDTCLLVFTLWQTRSLFNAQQDLGVTNALSAFNRPSLCVIIAAHNEDRALSVTLSALAAQTDQPDMIIIADDGSTDLSADVLTQDYGFEMPGYTQLSGPSPVHHNVYWLRLPHGGKARALNAALAHVKTDLVVTVDADTLLEENAIQAMRQSFVNDRCLVAATGVLTPVCGQTLKGRLFQWFQTYEYVRNFCSRFAWMQVNGLLLISGAFAAFRKEALIKVGGFDPDCLVEDYELIHRLHRWSYENGEHWTVAVVGGARARTDAPETVSSFLNQRRRWFGGFLQTQRWNRDMVGNGRFGWLGKAMMPVKALDTLQPLYGIAAFVLLIVFVATGQFNLALPVLFVMLGKIIVDITAHFILLSHYRRWTGDRQSEGTVKSLVAALVEPFTFQLLRHAAAALGWWTFLAGNHSWDKQSRAGITGQVKI
jgi:cellulose synthase/poly-beta-1,6-N-acetylglucosamine synthase-like glycosyltransferase